MSLFLHANKKIHTKKTLHAENISVHFTFRSRAKNIKNSTIKVICSRSHTNAEFQQWVDKHFSKYELVKSGSSLKFCLLAEGRADIYPRLGPTSEWDIAAGHIILEEAGGKLKSIDVESLGS